MTAPRKTSATKAAAPASAQPQDFKQLPEQTPGWDLLIPFKKVKGSDQLRLVNQLQKIIPTGDGAAGEKEMDFDLVADFIDFVSEKFAVDSEVFDEWTRGEDGYNRAMTLAVAYGTALGE
jgi:hypothetical protein